MITKQYVDDQLTNTKFVGVITGNNTTDTYSFQHDLNDIDVIVQIVDSVANEIVYASVTIDDVDNITIDFGNNVKVGENYRIIIKK